MGKIVFAGAMSHVLDPGAVSPARADVRYFGELRRINLAAVEWRLG